VLELYRRLSRREPLAARALERWQAWQEAVAGGCSRAEARFERRSYERARAAAMGVLVMALARERRRAARARGLVGGAARLPRRGPRSRH
jgi:hypothetical protein